MTEPEVIQILRRFFESLFPKVCPNCNRHYNTLREYILVTKRIGPPRSYDADLGDWKTVQPIGSTALANCPCGSTLALTTENMALPQRLALLEWVKAETDQRGMSASELLEHLRDVIRKQVLNEPTEGNTEAPPDRSGVDSSSGAR